MIKQEQIDTVQKAPEKKQAHWMQQSAPPTPAASAVPWTTRGERSPMSRNL